MRLGDGVCSELVTVEQDFRRGCVLAPLLSNMFFAAVVAYTRFKADKDIVDALVHISHIISHISHIKQYYYGEIKNDFFF